MTPAYLETTGPKQDTRMLFAHTVRDYIGDPTNVLLMPGEDAHDAHLLRGMFPRVKIKGLDNSEDKAQHIATQHWQCIDDIYAGSVKGYAWHSGRRDDPDNPDRGRDVFPRMDAIWLDHTGGCTEKNLKDLLQVVEYSTKKKCVFAATFTSNPRGASESADHVVRDNAWLEPDERYNDQGQHWTDARAERQVLNTHDKIANAVRTAIDGTGILYRKLDIAHSMSYQAREGSTKMHFFILRLERF